MKRYWDVRGEVGTPDSNLSWGTNQTPVFYRADQWERSTARKINTNTDLSSPATVTIREIYKESITALPSNTIISAVGSPTQSWFQHWNKYKFQILARLVSCHLSFIAIVHIIDTSILTPTSTNKLYNSIAVIFPAFFFFHGIMKANE